MERSNNHVQYESMGTLLWMIVDFIWICGYPKIAAFISPISGFLLVYSCIVYSNEKKTELFVLFTTVCWFIMNILWMVNEITELSIYLTIAKIVFFMSSVLFIIAYVKSKKENVPFLFRRIK